MIENSDDTDLGQAIAAWGREQDRLVRSLLAWRQVLLATTDEEEAELADDHFHETVRALRRAVERRDDLIAERDATVPQVPVLIEPDPVGNVWGLAFPCPWCPESRFGPRWHHHGGGSLDGPPALGLRLSRCPAPGAPAVYDLVPAAGTHAAKKEAGPMRRGRGVRCRIPRATVCGLWREATGIVKEAGGPVPVWFVAGITERPEAEVRRVIDGMAQSGQVAAMGDSVRRIDKQVRPGTSPKHKERTA